MHLTNYAINKDSYGFIFNGDPNRDDVGHKRSIKAVFRHIDDKRFHPKDGPKWPTSDEIWTQIKDMLVKTLITAQPSLAHTYRSSKPDDFENSLSFQILGFDVFLDHNAKPWLLEVN